MKSSTGIRYFVEVRKGSDETRYIFICISCVETLRAIRNLYRWCVCSNIYLRSKLSFLTRIFYFLRWDICRIFQRRVQPSPVCSFFFSFLSEYIDQIGNNNRKILPLSKRKRTVQAKIYINKHKYDASIENCEPFSEIERKLPFKFHEKQVHGNGVPVSI